MIMFDSSRPDGDVSAPVNSGDEAASVSFEQLLGELESIVTRFETNQMSLDQAIKAYERGVYLQKQCASQLQQAQKQMEVVMNDAARDGALAQNAKDSVQSDVA